MRNLKKILALVLALVMSLSLMVTAGAKDFPDSDGITNDAYALAVDILSDLDVFNGDQNGNFNPTSDITRAEVAAIIYRIATGDVGVDGYKTYAPYNQFKDINVEDWYAGYVTYCANAGYIKGRNTGNFDAKDPVTGYEVLAMILRAVGYDKNNEFVGSNWQLNTASIATEKGVLANILKDGTVRLSDPASRQVVAEMLFRAIQIPQVTWNAATLSYIDNGETLAKQNLGMESVTGVIMANKWANINEGGTVVLPEGQTQMLPFGEAKNLTLDVDTDLDAVGQTYTAYIQNDTRVLGKLEYREDLNTVAFNNGAETTVSKLSNKEGLKVVEGSTVYFLNYDEDFSSWDYSDIIIRYAIRKADVDNSSSWKAYYADVAAEKIAGHTVETRDIPVNWDPQEDGDDTNNFVQCYVFRIAPESVINEYDIAMMKQIFYTADRLGNNINPDASTQTQNFVYGEVYVGTSSMEDVSDTLSWKEFEAKYFNPDGQYNYTGCKNGESLRIIDNDNNGVADYIFKVEYWQDKAVDTEKDELVYYVLDLDDYDYSTFEDEIAVGDVVNYTAIDSRVTVYKAGMINGKVLEKNFENETILTTADDTNYGQSEIYNDTFMLDQIMNTEDETEYNFYLDEFGYIRTYELAQGTQYALLTEIYNTTGQAYNYVNTNVYTAEVVIGDEEAHEYRIANNGNPFISAFAWTSRISNYYYTDGDLNFLQPAIAHLGVNGLNAVADETLYIGATLGKNYSYVNEDWSRGVFGMADTIQARVNYEDYFKLLTGTTNLWPYYGVFDYGAVAGKTWDHDFDDTTDEIKVAESFSFTNVAIYGLGDNDTITLRTASKLKYDKSGAQLYYWQDDSRYVWTDATVTNRGIGLKQLTAAEWRSEYIKSTGLVDSTAADKDAIDAALKDCLVQVYDVDYVQLQKEDIAAGKAHYYIDTSYGQLYHALSNGYVNATVETEFYIAMPNKVLHYVGYDKLPTIDDSHVRAAYAVATNTYQDSMEHDYWIANVIVIEVEDLDDPYDSVSLMYYNPNEVSGSVRSVRSLNNMWRTYQPDSDNEANIPVVPKTSSGSNAGSAAWGNQSWTGSNYGFYEIYDSTYADGTLNAGDVKLIPAVSSEDWAGYGIYAGTIQRIYGLTSSEYIDVDFLGRAYKDGGIHDEAVQAVSVTTGDTAVPIYRVNAQNTTDLRLGKRVSASDIQLGDQIILVYNKAHTALAYIVDLGTRTMAEDGFRYVAADWLWNNYYAIVGSQDKTVSGAQIIFDLGLGEGETVTFTCNGETSPAYTSADTTATLNVAKGTQAVTVTIRLGGDPAPKVSTITLNPSSSWQPVDALSGSGTVYTQKFVANSIFSKSAKTVSASVAGGIYTVKYVTDLIAEAGDFDPTTATEADIEAAKELLDKMNAVFGFNYVEEGEGSLLYELDSTSADNLGDAIDSLVTAIGTANGNIEDAAFAAEQQAAKDAALIKVGNYMTYNGVKDAYDALIAAIESADTAEKLEAIYKDGALVDTQEKVDALLDAIAAAETQAKAGTTLPEGVTASGVKTMILAGDVKTESRTTYGSGDKVVIDLNEYTLSSGDTVVLAVGDGADVTLKNGTILLKETTNGSAIGVSGSGKLTLEGVTIEASGAGKGNGVVINSNATGTVEIRESTITGGNVGMTVNGNNTAGVTINITNSNFTATGAEGCPLYLPGKATTNIIGGTFEADNKTQPAIEIKSGVLNISGATLISGDGVWNSEDPSGGSSGVGGTTAGCSGITVSSNNVADSVEVYANNCTFEALVGVIVRDTGLDNGNYTTKLVRVIGGNFDDCMTPVVAQWTGASITVNGDDYSVTAPTAPEGEEEQE